MECSYIVGGNRNILLKCSGTPNHITTLPQYRLICIYTGWGHEAVAFSPYDKDKKEIVIVHVDDHYHACSSLKGYRQNTYVCNYCLKGYNDQGQHRCTSTENIKFCLCCRQEDCQGFLQAHPQGVKPQRKCNHCGRYFYDEVCNQNHLKYSISGKIKPDDCICFNIRRCRRCKKLNRYKHDIREHRCGYATCPTCSDYVKLEDHRCYIESAQHVQEKHEAIALEKKQAKKAKTAAEAAEADPDSDVEPVDLAEELIEEFEQAEGEMVGRNPDSDNPKHREPPIHIWFDIEARQETGVHEANLLIYQDDRGNEVTLWGDTCVEQFIKDLKQLTETTQRRLIVIAHNLQSYDGYFIIREMYRDGKQLTQIRNGAKILELEHYDIRFIDSLNFFAMPLKAFPSTFGLKHTEQDEDGNEVEAFYAKGYFPHLFNRKENEDYVGPLPPKEDYMPETMSLEEREKFDQWYDDQVSKNAVFDFKRDIKAYCQMDVTILREGCQMFRRLFQTKTEIQDQNIPGFNPFEHITIASACNRDMINRTEDETIASEPAYGWAGQRGNQSKEAMEWLLWLQHCKQQEYTQAEQEFDDAMQVPLRDRANFIQHAGNGGEKHINWVGNVDGYCAATKTAYEYQGCYFHGCMSCYPNRTERHTRLDNRQMWEVREVTKEKVQKLKSVGLQVLEMWSCQWKDYKKTHPECAAFVNNLNLRERLEPREAFFGGRTNAAKLFHACRTGEKIQYFDFTSLYPWVNKYSTYAIKHPRVILNPENQNIHDYFGEAKCIVRAPRYLYHPVLPVRVQGKLLFPLCVKCAGIQLDLPLLERGCECPHSDQEREFEGVWCTPELQEAQRQGYIVQILEVYHFPDNMEEFEF